MTVGPDRVTAEGLLGLPDDGFRRESIRGEVRTTAPAGNVRGRTTMNVSTPLDQFVRVHDLGAVFAAETGFEIGSDPDTVRAPDVALVSRGRAEAVGEIGGFWPGAPDLAVEVVSPNDRFAEVEEKVADWLVAGTRMAVNPRAGAVMVRTSEKEARIFSDEEVLDDGDVVPGWTLSVSDVFR